MNIFLLALDPALSVITFAYNFTPSDNFLGTDPDDEQAAQELKFHTLFAFGSTIIPQFSRGIESYGAQTKFPSTVSANGIYAFYPMDEYKLKSVPVTCRFSTNTEEIIITPRTSLSIAPRCAFGLNVRNSLGSIFSMDVSDMRGTSPQNAANGFSYDLSITINRPFMFRLYPGFVIFALWLIIIFELLIIFCISFFGFRKVGLPFPPQRFTIISPSPLFRHLHT